MKLKLRPPCATEDDVNVERDRRLAVGFEFRGKLFQARAQDQINMTGAASAASIAMANGATPGNYRWSDPDNDFKWISADNSQVVMDAPTTIQLGLAAIKFVAAHTMAARAVKDMILAGDYVADASSNSYWPS
jgi:hypothetical protein